MEFSLHAEVLQSTQLLPDKYLSHDMCFLRLYGESVYPVGSDLFTVWDSGVFDLCDKYKRRDAEIHFRMKS